MTKEDGGAKFLTLEHRRKVGPLLLSGVLVILGLCVFLFLIAASGHDDNEDRSTDIWWRCEDLVETRLVAPSTAQFSSAGETRIGRARGESGDAWTVVGYVDAQNRFGAMLRMRYGCVMRREPSGEWVLVDLYLNEP